MKYVLLLLTLLLVGCGNTIDDAFIQYVYAFEQDSNDQGNPHHVSLSIQFGEVDQSEANVAGTCYHYPLGIGNHINIEETIWNTLDAGTQKMIIYHELGHCVLGRYSHRNDLITYDWSYTVPISIMNAHCITGLQFNSWKQQYLTELFHYDQ